MREYEPIRRLPLSGSITVTRKGGLLTSILLLVLSAAVMLQGYAIYSLRQDVDLLIEATFMLMGEHDLIDGQADGPPEWEV
jgi:hypothetical protein